MANNRNWSLWLLAITLIAFTLLGTLPTQAQSTPLEFYRFTLLDTPQLGRPTRLQFTAVAKSDSTQITMENTDPFRISPMAWGMWTGFSEKGTVTQVTTLSFTEAGEHVITGTLKIGHDNSTTYIPVQFRFDVLPETTPEPEPPRWLINPYGCPQETESNVDYTCHVKVYPGLIPTIPNAQLAIRTFVDDAFRIDSSFNLDDFNGEPIVVPVEVGLMNSGERSVRFEAVVLTENNDALVLTGAVISVTVTDPPPPPDPFTVYLPSVVR